MLGKFTATGVGDLGISAITVAELQFGVYKSQHATQNQAALEGFLLPLATMDFDYPATVVYGKLRADLEAKGTPIGTLDMLIAAHALSLGATLVTNNTREFSRVPQLKHENWVVP